MALGDAILCVIALILPPLPVAIKRGLCSCDFLLNVLLCLIGVLPGLVHAWYIVLKYSEERLRYEALHGRDGHGDAEAPRHVFVYGAAGQGPIAAPAQLGVQRSTGTFAGAAYAPVPAQNGVQQQGKNHTSSHGHAQVAANGGPIVDYGATSNSGAPGAAAAGQNDAPPAYTPVNNAAPSQGKR